MGKTRSSTASKATPAPAVDTAHGDGIGHGRMIGVPEFSIPVKLRLRNKLVDLRKLRIRDGCIHYFLYRQDMTKQPMSCKDTPANRLVVAWIQIHDSPLTGKSPEEVAARAPVTATPAGKGEPG